MLHTNYFVVIRQRVPDKKIFESFFFMKNYGLGGHLDHLIQVPRTNCHSPYRIEAPQKNGFGWPSGFVENV